MIKVAVLDDYQDAFRQIIEIETGMKIFEIFEKKGEEFFREIEKNISLKILKKNKSVIEYVKLHKEIELEYPKLQKLIEKEIKIDTDAWVVEIEDKKGRNFFEKI